MAKVYLKKHKTEQGDMIAMCDEKTLGKVYKDKKTGTVLDLKKYREFYEGNLLSSDEALRIVSDADIYTGNIVGEESVGIVIKAGLATGTEIKDIGGIPSLHIYRII